MFHTFLPYAIGLLQEPIQLSLRMLHILKVSSLEHHLRFSFPRSSYSRFDGISGNLFFQEHFLVLCASQAPAERPVTSSCHAFSNAAACRCHAVLSRVQLFVTPRTVAHQAPLSMGFSRREYWNGLPFPPPGILAIQGSNLCLLHWQVNSSPSGKPF